MQRKFHVEVRVSVRPIGGSIKYGAVGYEDEAAVDGDDIEQAAHDMAHNLARKYRTNYGNTIMADAKSEGVE